MPLQSIFIDVVWKPGKVFFAKRIKRIVTDGDILKSASTLRANIAIAKADTFGKTPMDVEQELYFEVFDSHDSNNPILRSQNAP